jgi:hypothetical protein
VPFQTYSCPDAGEGAERLKAREATAVAQGRNKRELGMGRLTWKWARLERKYRLGKL